MILIARGENRIAHNMILITQEKRHEWYLTFEQFRPVDARTKAVHSPHLLYDPENKSDQGLNP